MSSEYRVAPLFLVRLAGVPFEAVEKLGTPEAIGRVPKLIRLLAVRSEAKTEVEAFFRSRQQLLSPEAYRELRIAVHADKAPVGITGEQPPVFSNYASAAKAVEALESEMSDLLSHELQAARVALIEASRVFLEPYLLFAAEGARGMVAELRAYPADLGTLPARNNAARKAEQSFLLYLQRIAAKNDTFSEFGPSSWGGAGADTAGVKFAPQPGITRREAFLERWTAHAIAAAINSDTETFSELCPRLNPNGILLGNNFVFADSGETQAVDDTDLLARCDGHTPVHLLGGSTDAIRDLVAKNILITAVEVPALDPFAFETLKREVAAWRAGPARGRWLPMMESLGALPKEFEASTDAIERQQILAEARERFAALGIERKAGRRSLYSAINPIAEECFRETDFTIGESLLQEIATEAAPWIDFWRDNFAFVASRVNAGLQMVLQKAPMKNGALPLPAFLRACEMAQLPLAGPGLVGLAHIAFQEVKAGFRERMKSHSEKTEYELTAADCHFVRENFRYEKFDEFTYPSADIQLAATSADAINRGEYRWILSELHPPLAILHHAAYWSCPDPMKLAGAFSRIDGSFFHFGFFAADFTAHTSVHAFDAMPKKATFVAPQRANPAWRRYPPAHTEVYVHEGDVRLRHAATREDLGSFARNWIIPLGFHPFQFGMSPQMPRLRCGRVIVQRRAWTVTATELGDGDFSGVSRELVRAIERLRAARGLPRYVYIRPTEQALRRSGAEGRDKDTKPVFIDLESYLFLEIFQRWLTRAGELEVTEMLPAPNDLWWREADGRRTFELRTLILPRP